VITPTSSQDSFLLNVNVQNSTWSFPLKTSVWVWQKSSTSFNLNTGTNTITLKNRESGTQIDKLLITNDPNYVPSGLGDPAENLPSNPGDVNRDKRVDILDIMIIIPHVGKTSGYDSRADVKKDNVINVLDLVEVARHWGKQY